MNTLRKVKKMMKPTYYKYKEQLKIAIEALEYIFDWLDCGHLDLAQYKAEKALDEIEKLNISKNEKNTETIYGMLRCSKCGEYKPFEMFPKDKHSKYGYYHYCRECNKHRAKVRRQKLKERKNDKDNRI